ncbi:MAG: class I tRNA ligase family protein [bacterium]|nr:class I tRNA ligase family protein [bacterium]
MPAEDNFKKIEEEVLEFWEKHQVFEKSIALRQGQGKKRFVFFEGPPTANGRPGIHHFIGRVFKDLFNRYKTMRGFLVERKSGWDTHGLPVEIEVEKSLGLKSKKEIEEYGIAKFNKQAKESVWKYKDEWERFTKRIGFWIDLKNPYITYDPKYIESLWHIFKKVWEKKLLFKGHKVVPFCTRCGTPLSSHEVAQGYKEVTDKSIYIKFRLLSGQKFGSYTTQDYVYILAWTTTPWTLPGNVALAVGKNIKYSAVRIDGVRELLILASDLVDKVLAGHIIERVHENIDSKDLIGLQYEPLFEIPSLKSEKSYRVYPADFVTTTDGTGIVHTAVMYGEDDYRLGKEIGLPQHHTVDKTGHFTSGVSELSGKPAKDKETDKIIIEHLRSKNLLLKEEEYTHDYPFCWRCGNPLLYYAMNSWFIGMSRLEKDLVKNNQKINWYPGHLKEGRFGEWLKGVKDWAISRDRYWGTPLPIWKCQQCNFHLVVGSLDELEKKRYRTKNTFYILRHGLSVKNGAANGGREIISSKLEHDHYDLVPEGVAQIKKVAEQLKKIGGVNLLFSSPFLRTKSTAEIIARSLGLEVQLDERLGEIDYGYAMEGQPLDLYPGLGNRSDFETKRDDGESWNDVRRRMFAMIRDLNQKNEGKNILLVSHGDPLWLLRGISKHLSEKEMLAQKVRTYVEKGQVIKLNFANYPYNEKGELDPHRPYIDEITLKCAKCSGPAKRISEVADVWFDSGAMPYAQWHYPFENKDKINGDSFRKAFGMSARGSAFPADFITEAIDQTRGWFYTMLAVSTLMGDGPAYKNVLSYGHVLDEKGQKMSKSKDNVVDPWMVIEQYGADAARWYFYTVNSPGEPKLFSMNEVGQRLRGMVMTLWNIFRFYDLYSSDSQLIHTPGWTWDVDKLAVLDRWILSRLHQTIKLTTEAMDNFDSLSASRAIEQFIVDDFSKWWLRRSRARLKENLLFFRFLLIEISKLIAPFTPFIAEKIHQELYRGSSEVQSVHWNDWPEVNKKFIDLRLEEEMALAKQVVNTGLAFRKKHNIKVRQPLQQFSSSVVAGIIAHPEIMELIKDELNVKAVVIGQDELDLNLDDALRYEGWAREMVRQIQDMRKEAGYKFSDKVVMHWHTDDLELKKAMIEWEEFIKQNSLLKEFSQHPHFDELSASHTEPKNFDIQKEFELETGRKIWIGVRN